jgi:hypothetical protein
VQRRVQAAIAPAWEFEIELADGTARHALLTGMATFDGKPLADFPTDGDKLLLLSAQVEPDGCDLAAREFDHYLRRWGPTIRRESRQYQAIAEQLFALVWQAVAPIARIEPDPNDAKRIVLTPRGRALPRATDDALGIKPGDVFLPVVRRTTRGGDLMEDGIQAVPWTYIEITESNAETIAGNLYSGSRRPLGGRRRGRVETLAAALRGDPQDTIVRLRSRTNAEKPLAGYDIFAQNVGEKSTTPLGSSGPDGRIRVPPGDTRIQTLFIKHGGQLLARLPIVPGALRAVDIPLPDDDMRLAAESHLAAVREDLVDLVARRNILMSRARQKIEQRDFESAKKLLRTLDELPSRSEFNLKVTSAARRLRQRRIDQLFEATQTALAQHLDTRPISQLHDELREAQK